LQFDAVLLACTLVDYKKEIGCLRQILLILKQISFFEFYFKFKKSGINLEFLSRHIRISVLNKMTQIRSCYKALSSLHFYTGGKKTMINY
jgi:hypothetical protein